MHLPQIRITINNKLLLLAITVIGIAAGGLLLSTISTYREQYHQQVLSRIVHTNEQSELQLLQTLNTWQRTSNQTSQQVQSLMAQAPATESANFTNDLLHIKNIHPEIRTLIILNSDRQILHSTSPENVGQTYPASQALQDTLTQGITTISRTTNHESRSTSIPIFSPFLFPDEIQRGATVIELNVSILNSTFSNTTEDSYTYIIDNQDHLYSSTQFAPDLSITELAPVSACRKTQTSTQGIWQGINKQLVIGSGLCFTHHNLAWIIVTEQPYQQAYAPFQNTISFIALVASVLIAVTIVIHFLGTQVILRPLHHIQTAISTWNQGQLDLHLDVSTNDELETISTGLNKLSTRLRQQTNRLHLTTKLLFTRDLNLRQANDQIEQEKDTLEAERNKLSLILAGISDAVIAVDRNGHIVLLNSAAEQMTGYRFHQVLGKPVDQVLILMSTEGQLSASEYCPPRTNQDNPIAFEKVNLQLIGARRQTTFVNITSIYIQDRSAFNVDCIITLQDVTKEQDLERMKLDFVSMAAHELRTPLTTVLGFLSMVQGGAGYKKLPAEDQDYLVKATQSAVRLNKLIENLLAVSRIQQGRFTLQKEEVHVDQLIQRLTQEMAPVAQTKGIHLTYTPPPQTLPAVMADSIRIEEVISNLIGNAIKYTPQGSVHASVTQQDTDVVVAIKDTGPGIPPDAMAHLFTKFFRIKSELTAGATGTGLGLYISKNIIESHGGKIWAESQPGQGATFAFSLPIATSVKNA